VRPRPLEDNDAGVECVHQEPVRFDVALTPPGDFTLSRTDLRFCERLSVCAGFAFWCHFLSCPVTSCHFLSPWQRA